MNVERVKNAVDEFSWKKLLVLIGVLLMILWPIATVVSSI
jgi:hypothetical protein